MLQLDHATKSHNLNKEKLQKKESESFSGAINEMIDSAPKI